MNGKKSHRPMNKSMHSGKYKAGCFVENALRPDPVHNLIPTFSEKEYAPIVERKTITCSVCKATLDVSAACHATRCTSCRNVIRPCKSCTTKDCKACKADPYIEEAVQIVRRGR